MPNPNISLLPEPVVQVRPSSTRWNSIQAALIAQWARIKGLVNSQPTTSIRNADIVSDKDIDQARSIPAQPDATKEEKEVDEVVVDRVWSDDLKSSVTQYDSDQSVKSEGHLHGSARTSLRLSTDQLSTRGLPRVRSERFTGWGATLVVILSRVSLCLKKTFFSLHFDNPKTEATYLEENWSLNKSLALWTSVFLLANWVLGCAFIQPPIMLIDKIFYFAIGPILTIPILFMTLFDWPRDRPCIYQATVCLSTWSWPLYQIFFLYLCGFYNPNASFFTCGTKDFLSTFYYTSALQSFALFGLKMNRCPGMIGTLLFLILSCVLIVPIKVAWSHNLINFALFNTALLYMHYMRELRERHLFSLREELRLQCKETQKAQMNERKAADSKRRLTSWVRVPLNTALLAVQNLEASGIIAKEQAIEFSALEGSLSMMSKVLNDVLDFNRMDSGKLESLSRPYCFHQVMRSLFIPVRLVTNARNLAFDFNLDKSIDQVARRAAYEAMGEDAAGIFRHMEETPDVEGIVVGDETRLRQIVTNLASNACKFTPAGGKLTITTRLVLPTVPPSDPHPGEVTGPQSQLDETHSLSTHNLSLHNLAQAQSTPLEWIVVRIEVTDTGCGIRPEDMVHSKLFSAFNQTEQGRLQGGKGTGLGLALVRQIVKLSGGRLGVKSQVGRGSTFWVELPLGVGTKTTMLLGPQLFTDRPALQHLDDIAAGQIGSSNDMTEIDGGGLQYSNSSSALHDLMEQGGRVELVLSGYDSTSFGPGRAVEESPKESEEVPLPSSPPEEQEAETQEPPSLAEGASSDTVTSNRPTRLSLPPPRSFSPSALTSPPSPLPSPSSDALHSHAPPSPTEPSERCLRVLVVDDDPLTRTLMRRMLTRLGCKVETAENGEIALEMIMREARPTPSSPASTDSGPILEQRARPLTPGEDERYTVVFLDNQMPVMTGLELVAKLRGLGRRDFIVGITGNALLTDQQEYLVAGVDHVLTKPVLERNLRGMLDLAVVRQYT